MKHFLFIASAAICFAACSEITTEELNEPQNYGTRANMSNDAQGYYRCDQGSNACHLDETNNTRENYFEDMCAVHGVDPENPIHLHCWYCYNHAGLLQPGNNSYGGLVFNYFDPNIPLSDEFIENVINTKKPDPFQNKGERIMYTVKDTPDGQRPEAEFEGNLYWHYYYCHPDFLREQGPTHNGGAGFGQ